MFDIYNKTNLYTKYVNICKNKQFSEILSFILWVNNIFISYCEFNFQFIKGLNNNLDDEELLLEFISKKNDLINCALLINSTFAPRMPFSLFSMFSSGIRDIFSITEIISSDILETFISAMPYEPFINEQANV